MIREESWQVTGATLAMLRQITSLGYTVSVHRIPSSLLGTVGGFFEMHAIDLQTDPPVQQMARGGVDEGGDTDYRCASLLAEVVGIEPE
jgi:hypothetical protein